MVWNDCNNNDNNRGNAHTHTVYASHVRNISSDETIWMTMFHECDRDRCIFVRNQKLDAFFKYVGQYMLSYNIALSKKQLKKIEYDIDANAVAN